MSENKLRPCPFCGGKAITATFLDYDDLDYMAFEVNDSESIDGEVTCENERCINGWYLSPKDWNTRPIEDALESRLAELEAEVTKGHELQDELTARIAELSPAVGLMTTLKPTMVMDAEHPLEMAIEVVEHVNARIVELEALLGKLIEIGEWGLMGMVIATSYSGGKIYELAKRHQDDWYSLVKDWKEREE